MARTPSLDFRVKPVIGVIHLPPLPGAPRYRGDDVDELAEYAAGEASKLLTAGVDGVIVENYGDKPFSIRVRNPLTLAAMTVVVRRVAEEVQYQIPVGVSLLRNSGPEAIAVAFASGASFVRVNAYCEPRVAPEGILEPVMREVEEVRALIPRRVQVLADIDCKHSKPLTHAYNAIEAARECVDRGDPDAIIVTGGRTSTPPPPGYVAAIAASLAKPVLVGSGITPDNIRLYWNIASGFIVGTYLKEKGVTRNPVDVSRAKKLITLVKELRGRHDREAEK